MGDLVLFLSKRALASIEQSDDLCAAVERLAISKSPVDRAEWIKDAHWLLKQTLRDLERGGAQ